MAYEAVCKALTQNGFAVRYFETAAVAADYLTAQFTGEIIGFGGSMTLESMGMFERLSAQNKVYWHWEQVVEEGWCPEFTAYLCSANGLSETGEIVNIDGTGNRLSATMYGPKKLYYVVGTNKITPDLPTAIARAETIAAPRNAQHLGRPTPCTHDAVCKHCRSPKSICNAMVIQRHPMSRMTHTEVVLINEPLGF